MGKVMVDELMVISAVRYALGRSTYIVSATADEVKQIWGSLSDKTRYVIHKDVKTAVTTPGSHLGMKMDSEVWVGLVKFMEHNTPSLREDPLF